MKKVFVGGISPDTTEEHMEEYFSRYGRVESVSVITDKETGKSRGFGFVTYFDFDPVDEICGKIYERTKKHLILTYFRELILLVVT